MKNIKSVNSKLTCKATASLSLEIEKDLEKEDKSLGNLLNEQKSENGDVHICRSTENSD